MEKAKFVILGGGMVAGYAAKQMVEMGLGAGELAMISADDSVPYERPPLSKGFLAGKDTEEAIRINAEDFYRAHGISLRLKCEVARVDAKTERLILKDGGEVGFEKLVIATGAHPRKLDVPGAGLDNVLYLRSLDDSKRIRLAAEHAKTAVVVGGGFIGMEVAAVLAQKNIAVTMVLNEDRIWKRLFTPEMSAFFEKYYALRKVQIVKSASVAELRGDGSVASAVIADGKTAPCDIAVIGVGVQPGVEMLADSGLKTDNGVVVNEYLEASEPDIYAAGDVANYWDVLFNKRRRVEHWDNAVSQGQHCARVLMGERAPFRHVPYFFSDVFDLSYEYWGDASEADRVVHRGDTSTNSFSAWWLKKNVIVAAFAMNRPDEERELAPKWIESKQKVSAEKLANPSQSMKDAAIE